MNPFRHMLGLAVIAFTSLFGMDAVANSPDSVAYIQGGAPAGGDGSKEHPFNSFSQAEAASWEVLKVLPSTTVISGGIELKDGQKILGTDRAQCLFESVDDSVHNGDVIVANGNNCITGITVTTAFRCAISALNAKNLTVTNCSFNKCNLNDFSEPIDYYSFSTVVSSAPWSAIDFHGGPTVTGNNIQPFNTTNGKFTLKNCSFDQNAADVLVGSGDAISTSFVNKKYVREYEISRCDFSNISSINAEFSINLYASGGSNLFGGVRHCTFKNVQAYGTIKLSSIIANNPSFPGRGNYDLGTNEVKDCTFTRSLEFSVLLTPQGNLTGNHGKWIVTNNRFVDCGILNLVPPAVIEAGYASIQTIIYATASGKPVKWIVQDNRISDSTGLVPSISCYFYGGTQKIVAEIEQNVVVGTTTGVDILFYGGSPGQANGDFFIAQNKFKDNDSVLVVATTPDSPFTNLKVRVEQNCFENTGARNSPPIQKPPFDNGSYYGAAVIFGGADNTALALPVNSLTGDPGPNATVDLGGGPLHSKGHNNFIHTTGADTWVEPGLTLWAKKNWFGGNAPIDAGVGGVVKFDPVLKKGPKSCCVKS